MKPKQDNSAQKAPATQETPKSTAEPTSPATAPVNRPSPKPETAETKDRSSGWPARGDVFWPSWALVFVTIIAVRAALKTLGSINAQVDEMRKTGEQTDKLIAENIAQSKSLEKSVAEATRSAAAMEKIATEMTVSSKAATASVSAINMQMRAYLCVVIGSGTYQEREKNLRFEVRPLLINAGHTPAHNVSFRAKAAILPFPLPADFAFPLPDKSTAQALLGPHQNAILGATVDDFCEDSDIETVKRGDASKTLYIWGVVNYEDVFGASRYTNFCQILTWLTDGKTTWGYYVDRHNDAN